MSDVDLEFDRARSELLDASVAVLEGALPSGTPARRGAGRSVWDVLLPDLTVGDVQPAVHAIAGGPGGEMTVKSAGNTAFCSAESSALMAVNFLAPFRARSGLLGLPTGALTFERELRVDHVRSRLGPTLDAVLQTSAGSVAIEVKTCEPWRGRPKRSISKQYDEPAARLSPGTFSTLQAVRDGAAGYRCLDAAQLLKHLLGVSDAFRHGHLSAPIQLVLLYWRPTHVGAHGPLFDRLEAELADFAERVSDQPIRVLGLSTRDLLTRWRDTETAWLREYAASLAARYDPTTGSP